MNDIPEEGRRYLEVLLVEDSPGDVRLTREAFRDANTAMRLHVTSDGAEAIAFLHREGEHSEAPRPDVILLDLNLPKIDGREVLAHIKQDRSLKSIPTAILSSSDAPADIARSYQLQANCYLAKPAQWDAFVILVNSINDFWLKRVKLPSRRPSSSPIAPPDYECEKERLNREETRELRGNHE
jgi:chemotaxis family two-component system response regulator Rcp1